MVDTPTHEFSSLWNDLPRDERDRLHPFLIEQHYLHVWQVRERMIASHKLEIAEIDAWLANIKRALDAEKRAQAPKK